MNNPTLFDILLKVSELEMDIDTAEKKITKLFTDGKNKCPHCRKNIPLQSKNIVNGNIENVENFRLGDD